MRKHERGYVSNDGKFLVEKEEMETECECRERPYPLGLMCRHENQMKIEIRWFVYDLSKARPGEPTVKLDGSAMGVPDSVFEAATLAEVRDWLGEAKEVK